VTIHALTNHTIAARPSRLPTLADMPSARVSPYAGHPMPVLVIDDSAAQRRLICHMLSQWGYDPVPCETATHGLEVLKQRQMSLVVCDWVMPEMSGPEFCAHLRKIETDGYSYAILLTSKIGRDAITAGLDSGADDFLSKPVHPPELLARLRAGERILQIHSELQQKNALLSQTLEKLSVLYVDLDRDLQAARDMQQALVREPSVSLPEAQLSLMLRASGHVGGDLVGYFPAGEDKIGMFSLDVSGHGVSAAMITARLARLLLPHSAERNLCLRRSGGGVQALPPVEVAQALNRLMLREDMAGHYFTLCYVLFNLKTGTGRFVQAGHPLPFVLRNGGTVQEIGTGGLPIGLLEDADWVEQKFTLTGGDRLFLYSDGWIECPNPQGQLWQEAGLAVALARHQARRDHDLFSALTCDLEAYAGGDEFVDDISAAMLAYRP